MILPSLWPISLITRLPTTRRKHHAFDSHYMEDEPPSILSHDMCMKIMQRISKLSRGNGTQLMKLMGEMEVIFLLGVQGSYLCISSLNAIQ